MIHTKGKWKVVTRNRIQPTIETSKEYIAKLLVYGDVTNPKNWNMANAQLIAAAPDLLEACHKATYYLIIKSNNPNKHPIIKILSQAIFKAEGGII